MRLVLVLAIVACGGDDGPSAPADATVQHDGRPPCLPGGNVIDTASCSNGKASTMRETYSSQTGCPTKIDYTEDNVCAQGCALDVYRRLIVMNDHSQEVFAHAPRVLCKESLAHVGDLCDATGAMPCLPTRAVLNADGTVASQEYLSCVSGHCAVNPNPPTASLPLAACASTVVAQHGGTNVNGFVEAETTPYDGKVCLLAWNDQTQTTASGMSRKCVGDWQCAVGMLCDDALAPIGNTGHAAVCKPGPRGTLTPSMLSP